MSTPTRTPKPEPGVRKQTVHKCSQSEFYSTAGRRAASPVPSTPAPRPTRIGRSRPGPRGPAEGARPLRLGGSAREPPRRGRRGSGGREPLRGERREDRAKPQRRQETLRGPRHASSPPDGRLSGDPRSPASSEPAPAARSGGPAPDADPSGAGAAPAPLDRAPPAAAGRRRPRTSARPPQPAEGRENGLIRTSTSRGMPSRRPQAGPRGPRRGG